MRGSHSLIALIGFLFVSAIIAATPAGVRINPPAMHPVTPAPIAVDDNYSIHSYTRLFPLSNDSGYSSYGVNILPTHGTLSPVTSSSPWYYPQTGFAGTDFFTYQICDAGACATATVTINVVNEAPVAIDDRYEVSYPYGRIGPFASNDYDPDGDGFDSFNIITQPSHGTLSPANSSNPWYYPAQGYSGPDSLTYQVCDSFNSCGIATVNINDDDANGGTVSCNARVGGPVNVINGYMYLEQTDYRLSGAGEALNLTRAYNSNSQQVNLFGKGWFTAYDESVKSYSSTKLRLYLSDGRAVDFNWSSRKQVVTPAV